MSRVFRNAQALQANNYGLSVMSIIIEPSLRIRSMKLSFTVCFVFDGPAMFVDPERIFGMTGNASQMIAGLNFFNREGPGAFRTANTVSKVNSNKNVNLPPVPQILQLASSISRFAL